MAACGKAAVGLGARPGRVHGLVHAHVRCQPHCSGCRKAAALHVAGKVGGAGHIVRTHVQGEGAGGGEGLRAQAALEGPLPSVPPHVRLQVAALRGSVVAARKGASVGALASVHAQVDAQSAALRGRKVAPSVLAEKGLLWHGRSATVSAPKEAGAAGALVQSDCWRLLQVVPLFTSLQARCNNDAQCTRWPPIPRRGVPAGGRTFLRS